MPRVLVAGGKRDVGDVQVGVIQQLVCDRETRVLDNFGIGRAALRQPTMLRPYDGDFQLAVTVVVSAGQAPRRLA